MIDLEATFLRLDADLRALRLQWALVGGFAVSLRSEPRTTRDIDLAVVVAGDAEAEQVSVSLGSRGYRYLPEGVLEQTDVGRLATVRFLAPVGEKVIVDLLFASSGIEPEVVAAAEPLEVFRRVTAPVVRMGHLIALKVLAGRAQDLADLETLFRYADERELLLARDSLELISRRGFDRGKDLLREFARLKP